MSKNLDLSGLAHGTYVLKVVASARISGTRDIIYSNELVHKISHFT
jgi:hypothetical protein